jgi:hypothetical protein
MTGIDAVLASEYIDWTLVQVQEDIAFAGQDAKVDLLP